MNTLVLTLAIGTIVLSIGFGVAGTINYLFPTAQATGCPTQFVTEHIDNALKAYEDGDTKEIKNQLDLAKEAVGQFEEKE